MKFIKISILLFFTGIIMAGCASQTDVRILEDRIVALERRNLELQQKNAESEREKQKIKSQIETYSETLEKKEQDLRNHSASLQATLDQIRNEIQMLSGKYEETNYRLGQIEKQSYGFQKRIARIERHLNLEPLANLEPVAKGRPSFTGSSTDNKPASPPKDASPVKMSENELYIKAKRAFDRGDYNNSRKLFEKLLKLYPNARHADNAQFWIGEVYYRQKKYEQAILAYQTVIEKYPFGNKVQASLLKQGFAFSNLGDKTNARLILNDLIKKYPGSSEAKIARQKLNSF